MEWWSIMQDSETRLRVGIDCGSKTVKIVALDEHDEVVHKSYMYHQTNIRSTLAHMKAAQSIMPNVDFLLDIGGQDIKCIWRRVACNRA